MSYCSGCCFPSTVGVHYLPQVALTAHATILSSASRTTLTQVFANPPGSVGYTREALLGRELSYTFPLYDGVSVVGFECRVGPRLLRSMLESTERTEADAFQFNALTDVIPGHHRLENDVLVIRLGEVPMWETITIDITFVGELKQDSQTDGVLYTLPNFIAPHYRNPPLSHEWSPCNSPESAFSAALQGISLTVDVLMEDSIIQELQSPTHSVKVALGRLSSTPNDAHSFDPSRAFATLRIANGNSALLERDFILFIKADGPDNPPALLETHPTLPGQRALMATLVPRFTLPPTLPEVVFIIDRSWRMSDKFSILLEALRISLHQLPVGIFFNICASGLNFDFLWPTSRGYDASSLNDALDFVSTIGANMGGVELRSAVVATVRNRLKEKDLEVLLLTDGQVVSGLVEFIRASAADNTVRFFSLAIFDAVSHSIVEEIARAGNGFSQSVIEFEGLDSKVVRMLKGALTPHVFNYTLEVQYGGGADDEFEVLNTDEPISDPEGQIATEASPAHQQALTQRPVSLIDAHFIASDAEPESHQAAVDQNLPNIVPPQEIQAPYNIPPLFPFTRTAVYILLDPQSSHRTPQSVTFHATSKLGPLELQIPIRDSGKDETIHQLAAQKAVIELEENHGWLQNAYDDSGNPFLQLHSDTQKRITARECQSLGIRYPINGKYCSFVALESDIPSGSDTIPAPKRSEARTLPANTSKSLRPLLQSDAQLPPPPSGGALSGASATLWSFCPQMTACWAQPSSGSFGPPTTLTRSGPLYGRQSSGSTPLGSIITARPTSMQPSGASLTTSQEGNLESAHVTNTSKVHILVRLQTFEGNWEWKQGLFDVLGCDIADIQARVLNLLQVESWDTKAANIVATLLALGFLMNKEADLRLWELVRDKAENWVLTKLPLLGPVGLRIESHKNDIIALHSTFSTPEHLSPASPSASWMVSSSPWAHRLPAAMTDLKLGLANDDLPITHFHIFVSPEPSPSGSLPGSFFQFSELPLKIRLLILQHCDTPTLFHLLHTCSHLRRECLQPFWEP